MTRRVLRSDWGAYGDPEAVLTDDGDEVLDDFVLREVDLLDLGFDSEDADEPVRPVMERRSDRVDYPRLTR